MAKGFTQRERIDFNETSARVCKYSTLRLNFAIATNNELELLQIDVESAFLKGDLEETIYIEQPKGFVDPEHLDWVYRLFKALYGLKQASWAWRKKIRAVLLSLGFTQYHSDPCLYMLRSTRDTVYLLVYVDDMVLAEKSL